MRIAFFADIHGNGYVLDDFFRQLARHAVDLTVFCGDVFGYYYQQEDILHRFQATRNLVCIKGNHDRMFLDMLDGRLPESALTAAYGSSYSRARHTASARSIEYLQSWADTWEYSADGLALAAFHGSPDDPAQGRIYPDTPLEPEAFAPYSHVILGHTHHKMERRLNKCLILNPGSIGQQRDGRGCSFLILDTANADYAFYTVTYPISLLRGEIDTCDPGNDRLWEVLYRAR